MNSHIGNKKIIEIVGPPGVGKSTIYSLLCRSWSSELNWIYQDALLAPATPSLLDFKKWLEHKARVYSGKKRAKSLSSDFGIRFIENNQELANLCWSHLSSLKEVESINSCYRSAYLLFNDFCRYQAILEAKETKPCVIEEGLLQKSFLVQSLKSFPSSFLGNYISLLPLAHTVIYIDMAETSSIVKRVKKRGKIIASHLGKDSQELFEDISNWQDMFNRIIPDLEAKNVKVLKIDAKCTPRDNVILINQALKNIQ